MVSWWITVSLKESATTSTPAKLSILSGYKINTLKFTSRIILSWPSCQFEYIPWYRFQGIPLEQKSFRFSCYFPERQEIGTNLEYLSTVEEWWVLFFFKRAFKVSLDLWFLLERKFRTYHITNRGHFIHIQRICFEWREWKLTRSHLAENHWLESFALSSQILIFIETVHQMRRSYRQQISAVQTLLGTSGW